MKTKILCGLLALFLIGLAAGVIVLLIDGNRKKTITKINERKNTKYNSNYYEIYKK